MKAALFDGTSKFKIIDKDIPAISENEVLVKVSACGICGTDIKIMAGKSHSNPPVVLGHEFCGKVVEIGPEVKNIKAGDFVSVDPNILCGSYKFCKKGRVNLCNNLTALGVDIDGGFAEYCVVPQSQCYKINNNSVINGALMEPLSCAIYGIQKADIKIGNSVLIIGAGMIGIMMIKLSKLKGAGRVVVQEVDNQRKQFARDNGADLVIAPDDRSYQKKWSNSFDIVIECAGTIETARQSINLVKEGGTIVYFGVVPNDQVMKIKPYDIYKRDITLRGSFLNPFTFSTAQNLINNDKIDFSNLDIAKFPLVKINEAIQNQREKKDLKAMIFFE